MATYLKEHKNKIIRSAIFAGIILACFILQNTPGLFPSIFGIHSYLIIPFVIAIAMFEGETVGVFVGLLGGGLWDIVAARGQGFHTVILMLACFGCGFLLRQIFRNNQPTALLLCTVVTTVHNLLYWLLFVVFAGMPNRAFALYRFYLPSIVYTVLFMPLAFIIVREIVKKFPRDDLVLDSFEEVEFEE